MTREVFWHFPGWLEALWYVLAVASVGVFAYGLYAPLRHYKDLPRPLRYREALKTVLSHRTIRRRDTKAGIAHAAMFYGFATLFIGTVVLAINTDVTERFFGWRFFKGDFYRWYSLILDVMGIVLLAGVLYMMVRRALARPAKLTYRWGDWALVTGLLYLLVTGFVLEGVRIAMDDPQDLDYSPAGWLVSRAFTGIGDLDALRMGLWWAHGLVALTLVAAIPYTKATHMLQGFLSLAARDPKAGKRLRPAPADQPAGYATLEDFLPVHLLQIDACTRCGKCHEACPALATGKPLSPRDVVLDLRDVLRSGGGPSPIAPETIWSCMQCNACVEVCPVGIEQAPIINQLRRRAVEEGELPAELQSTLRVVQKSGNSFGENKRRRGKWTSELDFEVPDARRQPVDVLWFVGDYASFDPRSQAVSRSLARLYRAAGVDFGILYDGERTAGNDVRRVGEEGLWEALAEENIGTLSGAEFNRIVTSDPHSLNTLRNEYPDLGGSWPVSHHTTFLLELIEAGRLDVGGRLRYRVTYHDPCYLGRHNDEYEAPRRILERLGCTLVEMPRNRDNSFCCGAGGGRIWIKDELGAERPSENRIREAAGLGELDYFVVACPKDVTMFEDAIKTSGHEDRLALRELTELLEEALPG
ncbi:heterodisulfide reductase-related iron-sulfur binding cluster [Solirubrobacter soli]|uniref:heterodisulfide reductase-related iron-sulfur binding cluster n=1 Tax=Solirubrobacter soli TaxID=363832 RepID=UPI00042A88CB|nr:heterodisulfide reductase-related iron-sulfur binding cluster [Solirubrobacter soli]